MNQFFARKPLSLLLEEMKGENRLRRILGPVTLTSLGVGAIIGTGIFVLTGIAYMLIVLFVFLFVPVVKNLEDILPDHEKLEKVNDSSGTQPIIS